MRSVAFATIAVMAVAALSGCGHHGAAGGKPAAVAGAAPPAPGRFLARAELNTQLRTGFGRGLYRLAVMSQPGERAADLGQSLPTGAVRDVSCRADAPQPASGGTWKWSCGIRWQTVDGKRKSTRYAVDMTRRGCFFAAAQPQLAARYDSTIRTYSEHPLNAFQSLRRGC